MKRRYIEVDFPIEHLNILALREGNAKRPIYRMHKWWARRLGSVFRMLILAAVADAETTASQLWEHFYHGDGIGDLILLDPFMGGGTTLVEALRLGAKVIGVDINPVAWFITKKQIEPVELEALDAAFAHLEATVGRRIRHLYRTTCPQGHQADIMYAFWIKSVPCPQCGTTVELWPNTWISRRKDRWTVVCPRCHQIFTVPPHTARVTCPECALAFNPADGVSRRGRYACPVCGHEETLLESVARLQGPLPAQMYGLEYYCPVCHQRGYKRADETDHQRLAEAIRQFEEEKAHLLFPRDPIPTRGRSDPRPVNHGYTHFWQLFNPRQLLALSWLLESILQIEETNVRELLLLAFSDALDANNMFCKYEVDYHKISLLFGLHAYHPIERPTENNVWGTRYGRGTFVRCFQKVRRGKAYGASAYERAFQDGKSFKVKTGERVDGTPAENFTALLEGRGKALLHVGSSEDLSFLPPQSVDLVVTDPPYFDNVAYAELADFFYVWLRLGLKESYPWFTPSNSWREAELVQNEKLGKSMSFFVQGLSRVLHEVRRVLKADGLLIFTFHHNQVSAWAALTRTLLEAGFTVTAAPVVRSEGKSGFHSEAGNIKYDVCLVCRPREGEGEAASWAALLPQIRRASLHWAKRTQASGMHLERGDLLTIVLGQSLVTYTRHWPHVLKNHIPLEIEAALTDALPLVGELEEELHATDNHPHPPPPTQLPLPLAHRRRSKRLGHHKRDS